MITRLNQLSVLAIAVVAGLLSVGEAHAGCEFFFVRIYFQNDTVISPETVTNGSTCYNGFRTAGGSKWGRYDSGEIALKPAHGDLVQKSMLEFSYKPTKGFKGTDKYALKVCGAGVGSTGCSTIEYDVTMN